MKKVICLILMLSGCAVQRHRAADSDGDVALVDTATRAVKIPDELKPIADPHFCSFCVTTADCRAAACPGICIPFGVSGICRVRQ